MATETPHCITRVVWGMRKWQSSCSPLGADPQILSLDGETPLYAAILSQNVKIVQALIQANPEVIAARDHLGATPLHWAAESGCEEIVKEILEVIKQVKGETALHRYRMTTFTKRAIIETGTLEAVNRVGRNAVVCRRTNWKNRGNSYVIKCTGQRSCPK